MFVDLAAPTPYLADLERSGLRVRRWSMDSHADRPDASDGPCARFGSWCNGDIGMFITDVHSSQLDVVEAEAVDDFVCIGLSFEDSYSAELDMEVDRQKVVSDAGIFIRSFRAGSKVKLQPLQTGIRTITLMFSHRILEQWPHATMPKLLHSAMHSEKLVNVRLSRELQRERAAITAVLPDDMSAPFYYQTKSGVLFWLLIEHLNRFDDMALEAVSVSSELRRRLEMVREMMEQVPGERLTVEAMARRVGLNRTKLRALFKQVYGMTLSEYRVGRLMDEAESLLDRKGMSVSAVAYHLGYSNASSFSFAYKKHFGSSPVHSRTHRKPLAGSTEDRPQ